ncbi:DNA cytosine methyltransferase [Campylobacter upsaliensis]|nr:DNA cytosine methyltransferase [Campylobacter upsaliensis]EAK6758368.1 DNA cytosine methyltransferase [Campylobacter upsaliensis]EBD1701928.1 DNA cytosine methyltransferase [Campylobacter upsaliensis]EID3272294.1 DNA cytosine methyltransferase [Campylobacter upsaliensis]EKM9285551.1 DNA cytosine methyltransferase [Campylobacter upsaliensis]
MKYNIVEFFVGAGGSHLGFMQEGFSTLYANDFDSNALKTLEHNNKKHLQNAILDSTDITQLNPKELKKKVDSSVDVMFGGIVCKGFSLAGERSPADERNQFYRYYLDIVKELRPKISVIENVKGMLNARILNPNAPSEIWQEVGNIWKQLELLKGEKSALRKKDKITQQIIQKGEMLRKQKQNLLEKIKPYQISVLDDIYKIYEAMGYKVQHKVLNAAWYGAATKRERLIIVATRADLQGDFHYPLPRFYDESIGTKLDFSDDELAKCKFKKPLTLREVLAKIDYTNENDIDNLLMQHNAKTIERFRYIKEGCNIADSLDLLPKHLQISKFYSRGGNMRLHFDRLAPTLVPGHSAFPLHPKEHRSITIREAATITGFPLEYKFFGSHTKRCEQVGNAVPPPLSRAIAKSVRAFLDRQI